MKITNFSHWHYRSKNKRILTWLVGCSSFLWLVIIVPFLSLHNGGVEPIFSPTNKGNQDRANYYMAGSIALNNDFKSLYPIPLKDIDHNAGWPECSTVKPGYAELAQKKGVENSHRFILPPPSSFLFIPLALLPYSVSCWIWSIFLGLCLWGSCVLSHIITLRSGGSQIAGLLGWMIWAFSPLALKALRTANATPILGLAMGLAAIGIFQNKTLLALFGCVLAGLLKGTSIIFAPLLLFMKRISIIIWGSIVVILINTCTILFTGLSVYEEYFTTIFPSTRLLDTYIDNQSIYGFLYRIFGNVVQAEATMKIIQLAGLFFAICFVIYLWIIRKTLNDQRIFSASVIVLTGICLIFSPYNWGHYALCFIPFITSLWVSIRNSFVKVVLLFSVLLVWLPLIGVRGGTLLSNEPFTSHMLIGETLITLIAVYTLQSLSKSEQAHPPYCLLRRAQGDA